MHGVEDLAPGMMLVSAVEELCPSLAVEVTGFSAASVKVGWRSLACALRCRMRRYGSLLRGANGAALGDDER